jgi:hypothetical protein
MLGQECSKVEGQSLVVPSVGTQGDEVGREPIGMSFVVTLGRSPMVVDLS